MIVVWNPTNEHIETVYQGRVYMFPPGHKERMEDSCAKHILTAFSPRGMVSLEYGDEKREDEIGAKGRDINRQFKIKQIETYNQTNEARKMQGASFLTPPPQVRKYAEELGIALNQPYVVKDKDRQDMEKLEAENKMLRDELSEIKALLKDLKKPEQQSRGK